MFQLVDGIQWALVDGSASYAEGKSEACFLIATKADLAPDFSNGAIGQTERDYFDPLAGGLNEGQIQWRRRGPRCLSPWAMDSSRSKLEYPKEPKTAIGPLRVCTFRLEGGCSLSFVYYPSLFRKAKVGWYDYCRSLELCLSWTMGSRAAERSTRVLDRGLVVVKQR